MRTKESLTIILPEEMEDLPVKIIRGTGCRQLVLSVEPQDNVSFSTTYEKRYAFIWQHNNYLKVALKDILWVKAEGNYTKFHLAEGKTMVVAFNLAVVEKRLPQTDFIRIHRSHIVNLQHVVYLAGNSLKIDNKLLGIGKEYRAALFEHFTFLGIRNEKPKSKK